MVIRKCTIADVPTIRKIALETWPVAYAEILSPEQLSYMLELMYREQALRDQFAKGHQFLLLESGANAIGFAGFEHHHAQRTTTRLHKLYVLPAKQGIGAGKALVEAVQKAAVLECDTVIELNVNKYNRAKEFYLRNGFSVIRDEIIDIGSGYVMDDHVMELCL